jgi:hypothetical protein
LENDELRLGFLSDQRGDEQGFAPGVSEVERRVSGVLWRE